MDRGPGEERARKPRQPVLSSRYSEYGRLGAWLRAQRTKSGERQQIVADKIGKPRQFLTKVEQGNQRIDVLEFLDLFRALNLDPAISVADLIRVVEQESE